MDSACREYPGEWFFPDDDDPPPADLELARLVCAECLVRADCKAFALREPVVGIWAGMTTVERLALGAPVDEPEYRDPAARLDVVHEPRCMCRPCFDRAVIRCCPGLAEEHGVRQLIRWTEVHTIIGRAERTVRDLWRDDPTFPQPLPGAVAIIGPNRYQLWHRPAVEAWANDRPTRRPTRPRVAKLGDEAWLRERYVDLGQTGKAIADELGCDQSSVSRALKRFGITARGAHVDRCDCRECFALILARRAPDLLESHQIEDLLRTDEIAAAYGLSRHYVHNRGHGCGDFPTPVRSIIGGREACTIWRRADIEAWAARRTSAA